MLKMPNKTSEKFITLKEASKISGYSPDYLGQLIRKGKLAGKQVYLNVAWMTTEEAVQEYLKVSKVGYSGKVGLGQRVRTVMRQWMISLTAEDAVIRNAQRVVTFFVAVMVLLCTFVAYALIVNIIFH